MKVNTKKTVIMHIKKKREQCQNFEYQIIEEILKKLNHFSGLGVVIFMYQNLLDRVGSFFEK